MTAHDARLDRAWRAVARCLNPEKAEVYPSRSREFAMYVAEEVLKALGDLATAECGQCMERFDGTMLVVKHLCPVHDPPRRFVSEEIE